MFHQALRYVQANHDNLLGSGLAVACVHRLVRLFGWTVLVAMLVGVLWPERPEPVATGSVAEVQDPVPSTTRAAHGPPAPPARAAPSCGVLPCGLVQVTMLAG